MRITLALFSYFYFVSKSHQVAINPETDFGTIPQHATAIIPAEETTLTTEIIPIIPTLQLLNNDADATLSAPSDTSKIKRCSRHNVLLGDAPDIVTLSLNRRDVSQERKRQQCELCRNSKLCKEHNICSTCDTYCENAAPIIGESVPAIESRFSNNQNDNIVQALNTIKNPQYRYYSLGSSSQKSTISLLARMFNVGDKTGFEKFIVLGAKKLQIDNNQTPETLIFDSASAFNEGPPQILNLGNSFKDAERAQEMVKAINNALEAKRAESKNKLNISQINDILEAILQQFSAPQPDPNVQETQTRCSIEDMEETANEIINIATRNQAPEPAPQIPDEDSEIRNPGVIQDAANVGDALEPGMVNDNEEGRLVVPSKPSKNKLEKAPIKLDNQANMIAEAQPVSQTPPTSANLITEPRTFFGSSEENGSSRSASVSSSEEQMKQKVGRTNPEKNDLKSDIISIVEDSLKAASRENNILDLEDRLGEEAPASVENIGSPVILSEPEQANSNPINIDNMMEEIEKIPNIVTNIAKEAEKQVQNAQSPNQTPSIVGQEPIVVQSIESIDSMENMDPNLPTFAQEAPEMPVPSEETPKSLILLPQASESNEIPMDRASPALRNSFPEETIAEMSTEPNAHSFGALVPAPQVRLADVNTPHRNFYFVGKDINLPLHLVKNENGVMELTVDMDKLCHCKQKNCTRKHTSSEEIDAVPLGLVPVDNLDKIEEKIDKKRFSRQDGSESELLVPSSDGLEVYPIGQVVETENKEVFKRSPNVYDNENDEYVDNKLNLGQEEFDDLIPIDGQYKFQQLENKIADDLDILVQLSSDLKKFNRKNSGLLNKGTVALLKGGKTAEKTDKMLDIAGDLLAWMKDLAKKADK